MTTVLLVVYLVVAILTARATITGLINDGLDASDPLDRLLAGVLGILFGAIWPISILGLGLILWASAKADKEL